MTTGSLPAGHVLAGRYEVLGPLGKGGMGVVYKAHDRILNETVAIKVLREDVASSAEMGQRFLAEIKLARRVSHRHVCRIHEYGQDGDLRYISMAFVDGIDVRQVVREQGPLPPARAFDLAIAVADGLEAIHDEGIIHRDLKTTNLMLDSRGQVRLMDFGIAKQWSDQASAGLTGTGMVVGTPEYMSPEQVRGLPLDFRSDLYALGIVVHELFTGRTIFPGETPVSLLMKHLQEPPALDSPDLPPALVPVLARALAKDREERYASAREMGDALREARSTVLGRTTAPATRPAPTGARAAVETVPPAPVMPVATTTARIPVAAPRPATTTVMAAGTPTLAPSPVTAVAPPPTPHRRWLGPALAVFGLAGLAIAGVLVLRAPRPAAVATASAAPVPAPTGMAPTAPAAVDPTPAAVVLPPLPTAPAAVDRRTASAEPRGATPRIPPAVALEVEGLLAEAETAFKGQHHRVALEFYEQALKLDPSNARARIGRDLCAGALAQAPAGVVRPARAFVSGRTQHIGGATAPAGPAGFESSTGVAVRRVDQGAAAPGKLTFEVEPAAVKPGDAYTVKVFMVNEGAAVLRLADATVTTVTDGRPATGPVTLLAREAPPRQRTLILSTGSHWRAETESWSLAVAVRTASGETYRNELAWK